MVSFESVSNLVCGLKVTNHVILLSIKPGIQKVLCLVVVSQEGC